MTLIAITTVARRRERVVVGVRGSWTGEAVQRAITRPTDDLAGVDDRHKHRVATPRGVSSSASLAD